MKLRIVPIFFLVVYWACKSVQVPEKPKSIPKGDYSFLRSYLTSYIQNEVADKRITGMSVAVVDDQTTIFAEGFGYSNKSKDKKATADTLYHIGSVSKIFTATAIMQLVENGKVQLDKPVNTYIPELKYLDRVPNRKPATVRNLLTHHAGYIGDRMQDFCYGSKPIENYSQEFQKLPAQLSEEYIVTNPDTVFSYCNTCFSLLGSIISKQSGIDYSEYVEKNIFQPTEMNQSGTYLKENLKAEMSKGYFLWKELEPPYIRDIPAGAFVSSVNDLSKFMKMLFQKGKSSKGNVLKESSLKEMFTVQNANVELDFGFKIGITYWLVEPEYSRKVLTASHGGDLPPYHSVLVTVPEYNIGVVVLSNTTGSSFSVYEIALKALAIALETKTGEQFESKPKSKIIPVTSDIQKNLEGNYISIMGFSSLKANGDRFKIDLFGTTFDMFAHEDGTYSIQYKLLGLFPIDIESLKDMRIRFYTANSKQYFALYLKGIFLVLSTKILEKPDPISEVWKNRLGKYDVSNPGVLKEDKVYSDFYLPSGFALKEEDGFVFAEVSSMNSKSKFPLQLVSDNEAVLIGEGRGLGITIRIAKDGDKEVLLYSGFRLVKK